jgi:hypothetical protein
MSQLSTDRLTEMLEIAGRATQGEWSQSSLAGGYVVGPKDLDFPVIAAVVEYNANGTIYKAFDNAEENLAHITTFDPSTCVELINRLLVAEAEVGRLRKYVKDLEHDEVSKNGGRR